MVKEKRTKDLSPNGRASFTEYIGYMMGASGIGIFQCLFATFMLIYYTQVVHVNPAVAGMVIAVSKIFDGFSDLAMGYLVDHTKSKYGKARPWFIRMIIPAVICLMLCFWQPAGLTETWQIIYMFVTYNLGVTICYTAINVPEQALISYTTLDPKSRGVIGGMHMLGVNVVASILVNSLFIKISTAFGAGDAYTQRGFSMTIAVYMVLYAIFSVICFLLTKERVGDTKTEKTENALDSGKTANTAAVLKSLVTNKYWVLCLLMTTLVFFLIAATGSATVYYTQYILGDLDLQATVSSLYTLSMLPALIITIAFIVGKLGKRNTLLAGMVMSAAGYLLPLISNRTEFMLIGAVLRGVGFGVAGVPVGSILQDSLTYGLWRDGFSSIGMGNAANSFANKIGTALGTAVMGFILDAGGFDSKVAVQPDAALTSINTLFTILPGCVCIVIAVLAIAYDLDKKYATLEADIKAGNIGENRSVR